MTLEDINAHLEVDPAPASSMEIIRVLHIDDEENVQMFLKIFIESDLNIKVTQVQEAEDAIQLIQTGTYDCFISDYDMPGMDGITLAGKIRKTSNIPIIIYTGRGSEEVAEKAFAAGIDDYIRKENAPAHYQLVSKRIRQAVERRRISESYKNLFDNASDAIFLHTLEGLIIDINDVGCKRVGYSKEELLGKNLNTFIAPQTINFKMNLEKIIKAGQAVFESTHISKNGQLIPVEVNTRVIKYMGIDAILSFSRDISDRKQLEVQMKERLEALQSHSSILGQCEDVNAVAKTTYQILHDVMGYNFFGLGIVNDKVLKFIPDTFINTDWGTEYPLDGPGICVRAVKTGSTVVVPDVRIDADYVGPKSGLKYFSELVVPVKIGGKVVAVLNLEDETLSRFTQDDVTLLQVFSEHIAVSLKRIDLLKIVKRQVSRIKQINRYAVQLTKLNTVEEIADCSLNAMQNLIGFSDGCLCVVESNVLKFRYIWKKGFKIHDISLDGQGITLRAVRTGESQLVRDTRLDADFVKDGEAAEHLSELDVPVKADGSVVAVINLEDPKPGFFNADDQEIVEILAGNISAALSRIENKKIIWESEKELARSESRFKYLLDSAPEGITVNVLGKIVYANQHFADMVGYTVNELLDKNTSELHNENYREMVRDRTRRRTLGENVPSQYEVELTKKDGSLIPVEYNVASIIFNMEKASLTFIREISDKHAKQALEKKISSLNKHIHLLNEMQNIEEITNTTLSILAPYLKHDILSIRYAVAGYLILASDFDKKSVWENIRPIEGIGVTAKAAREKKTIVIPDTRVDPDFVKGKIDSLSELAVPILYGEELLGIINVESLELNAFGVNEKILVEILAAEVGSAVMRVKSQQLEDSYKRIEELAKDAHKSANL
jgi:PAS domain S-box-containing protein